MLRWPDKDPGDVLDYGLDWSRALRRADGTADTIAAAAWTVPPGLVEGQRGIDGAVTTLWLSGGVAGTDYAVTCRITTGDGRVIERDVALLVRNI